MAQSIQFLKSEGAAKLRLKRIGYANRKANFVVHVEIHENMDVPERFHELDAVDIKHAIAIIIQWTVKHGAASAAFRPITDSGNLGEPTVFGREDFDWAYGEEFDQ